MAVQYLRYIHFIFILDVTCQKSFQWPPGVSQLGQAIFVNVCHLLCIDSFNCLSSPFAVEFTDLRSLAETF